MQAWRHAVAGCPLPSPRHASADGGHPDHPRQALPPDDEGGVIPPDSMQQPFRELDADQADLGRGSYLWREGRFHPAPKPCRLFEAARHRGRMACIELLKKGSVAVDLCDGSFLLSSRRHHGRGGREITPAACGEWPQQAQLRHGRQGALVPATWTIYTPAGPRLVLVMVYCTAFGIGSVRAG